LNDAPRPDPDADQARLAAAGDLEAFEALVRRHERAIVNMTRAMTGGDEDAEDLAQEIFVRAFRGMARFRGDSQFRTWLHAIALNVIRSHRSSRTRRLRLFPAPPAAADGDAAPVDAAVEAGFDIRLAMRDGVDRALAQLPDDLRAVVVLRDVQGLDYREIAEALQVPIGTVESRLFRARQRLKPLLAPLLGMRAVQGRSVGTAGPALQVE